MQPLLTIERLSKSFPGQVALHEVDLVINVGTTHALVGQNGSGQSTLIKILCGYHQPTGPSAATYHGQSAQEGTVTLTLGDARAAAAAGIRFVHQDLGLVGGLSAVENSSMGVVSTTRRGGRIDWGADTRRARQQ